jgi:hypothetical protein
MSPAAMAFRAMSKMPETPMTACEMSTGSTTTKSGSTGTQNSFEPRYEFPSSLPGHVTPTTMESQLDVRSNGVIIGMRNKREPEAGGPPAAAPSAGLVSAAIPNCQTMETTSGYEASSCGDIRDMIDMYLSSFRRHHAGDLFPCHDDTANTADDRVGCQMSPAMASPEVSAAFVRHENSFTARESRYGTPTETSWAENQQIEMMHYEMPTSINYTLPLTHI